MEHYKLVLPGHLNHYGFLFGGHMLQWIDEFSYITATVAFPGHEFVTIAMDTVEFHKSVRHGEVLRFNVEQIQLGTTSVRYRVKVYGEIRSRCAEDVLFATTVTFVSVDEHGHKTAIKPGGG